MKRFLCALPWIGLVYSMELAAHPYIYVDAEIEIIQANGAPEAVRVTWTYDRDFSDILRADFELDKDGDLALNGQEQAFVQTSVTEWPPGFRGDVYIVDPQDPEAISYPGDRSDHFAAFEEGQLVEVFTRRVPQTSPLNIAVYDPDFVTSYVINRVTIRGEGPCRGEILKADTAAAQAKLDALIAQMPEGTEEMAFPAVGRDFTDMVRVICD